MILTPQQIAQYAYNAGFRGRDLLVAVAVALRESGGNTNAYNPETAAGTRPGQGSRGLWQVYGTAHPWANNDTVLDPQANANAAYRVYKEAGGRFTPWSTWNNGSVLSLLPQLQKQIKVPRRVVSTPSLSARQTMTIQGTAVNPGRVSTTPQTRTAGYTGTVPANYGSSNPDPIAQLLSKGGITLKSGASPVYDFTAIGIGTVLIIIGLIALFFFSGAAEATGKAAVSVAKVAAL
jgi:hypothetical protein